MKKGNKLIDQQFVQLSFNRELYPKETILKAAFHFIDSCYIHLDQTDMDYIVELTSKGSKLCEGIENKFNNELLIQAVRFQVYKQTHVIRELLMARAMASTLVEISEKTIDETTNNIDSNLDEILVDWFEKYE